VGTISNILQCFGGTKESSADRELGQIGDRSLLSEENFRRVLGAEKKRSERFSKDMILMQVCSYSRQASSASVLSRLGTALSSVIRETDVAGWIEENYSLGVIFTELGDCEDARHAERIIRKRIAGFLMVQEPAIKISFKSFCDDWTERSSASNIIETAKTVTLPRKFTVETFPELAEQLPTPALVPPDQY
jgi:hypothetical protein